MHRLNLLLSFVVLLQSGLLATAADDRPNIIVILVDDMGFSDIGCYGGEIETPNLDMLAKEGLRFRSFYNYARCGPTRGALMTGLYPHQAGMGHMNIDDGMPGYRGVLNRSCVTLAEALRPAGYFTVMTGKWNLGLEPEVWPRQRGFDRFYGSNLGGIYYDLDTLEYRPLILDDEIIVDKGQKPEKGFYSTHAFTDYAIRFIDEAREQNKPFLLYLAHVAPHFPLQAPEATIDKYRGRYMAGWENIQRQRHARQIKMGLVDKAWPLAPRPDGVRAWAELTDAERNRMDQIMAIYAAVVEEMDKSIGKLVSSLRERGELDNTLILFMSDNGGNAESGPMGELKGGDRPGGPGSNVWCGKSWAWAQNTPFREFKHYVHEGGIGTPMIAHWPKGIDKSLNGQWTDEVGHIIDIMATCVDVSGARYPDHYQNNVIAPMQGSSLLPAFHGKSIKRDALLYWEHEGNRAVRDGDWKLVAKGINSPWELYNLAEDRTESNDLFTQHPETAKRLVQAWEDWAKRSHVVPMPGRWQWQKKQ